MATVEGMWIETLRIRKSPMKVCEVADFLGVSKQKIYKMVSLSQIPYLRVNGCIRFLPEEIIEWVRQQVIRPELPLQKKLAHRMVS
jgi:excisionase family DNA binding protein